MPIPFSELDFRVLLHHQGAYECIDRKGHQLFVDWDMSEFVKSVFGEGTCRFLFDERAPDLKSDFDEMEKAMPFLKYGESGQHYGYELFIVPPDKWQYRGEPFWWAYASRAFTFDKLPMDEDFLYQKYMDISKKYGFKNLYIEKEIYVDEYDAGGMGSGIVSTVFWRQGWYTVRNRNRVFLKGIAEHEELYLDCAISKLNRYCDEFRNWLHVKKEVDSSIFRFAMDASSMTEHQKQVVCDYWGIFTGTPLTKKEMSIKYGVTENRIKQIERRAMQHILRGDNNPLIEFA